MFNTSSSIQTSCECTSLSVPELHRVSRSEKRVADCTADREFHPALKTLYSVVRLSLYAIPGKMQGENLEQKFDKSIDRENREG